MITNNLIGKVFFDANWNSVQETLLVGVESLQLIETLQQNPCAAVELFV